MSFGHLQEVEAGEASMAIESFQYARNFLLSIICPTMVRPVEKGFKVKIFIWLENVILILIYANTVSTLFDYTFF